MTRKAGLESAVVSTCVWYHASCVVPREAPRLLSLFATLVHGWLFIETLMEAMLAGLTMESWSSGAEVAPLPTVDPNKLSLPRTESLRVGRLAGTNESINWTVSPLVRSIAEVRPPSSFRKSMLTPVVALNTELPTCGSELTAMEGALGSKADEGIVPYVFSAETRLAGRALSGLLEPAAEAVFVA